MAEIKYKFFQHKECEYFPCHDENQNCMFCYCPLFNEPEVCRKLGFPIYLRTKEGREIIDCSECEFPHDPENFDIMMDALRTVIFGDEVNNYGGGLSKNPRKQIIDREIEKLKKLREEKEKLWQQRVLGGDIKLWESKLRDCNKLLRKQAEKVDKLIKQNEKLEQE